MDNQATIFVIIFPAPRARVPARAAALLLACLGCARPARQSERVVEPVPIEDPRNIPVTPEGVDVLVHRAGYRLPDDVLVEGFAKLLEPAVRRPWTVERLAEAYGATSERERQGALVYLLAASKDRRGLPVVGAALYGDNVHARVMAAHGIEVYWTGVEIGMGGADRVILAARSWWETEGTKIARNGR